MGIRGERPGSVLADSGKRNGVRRQRFRRGIDYSGKVYAIDAQTGTQRWRFDPEAGSIRTSPTVADGTVYVGTTNLEAIDAATGRRRWQFETADSIRSSPTVAGSTVYIGSHDTRLYAVDTETGRQRWAFETDDPVQSSPTVKDGTVYVGGQDATVYAIAAESPDVDSRGSRVLLGTLGHHDGRTTASKTVDKRVSDTPDRADAGASNTNVFDRAEPAGQSTATANREPTAASSSAGADSVSFCPHCGADMTDAPGDAYCPHCGGQLRDD
ncbi:outer membrane protein assembly factor BamB family protein [Halosegnis longus]|uniref:Pyrrolo-quinoline quinone repeat domain-containing protein n=1 Tax=Halosegnis longus TaxID=2216012 RepID=A0AAJ4R8W2_9EURY|nr:hypothetical protein Nmn1133_06215 [Salella cibi]